LQKKKDSEQWVIGDCWRVFFPVHHFHEGESVKMWSNSIYPSIISHFVVFF
jgi:hypothetical protein